MTQTLYAHMNKIKIKKNKKLCFCLKVSVWLFYHLKNKEISQGTDWGSKRNTISIMQILKDSGKQTKMHCDCEPLILLGQCTIYIYLIALSNS
jgi:hypothetical protein